MADNGRARTGIPGLDDILLGGILRENVVLIAGAAGTGKTVLGTQFLCHGAAREDEPGILINFELSPTKLIRDAAGCGWDLEDLQRRNRLRIVLTSPDVLLEELHGTDGMLVEMASQLGARRLFIDNISLLPHGNGDSGFRRVLHRLLEDIQRQGMTAVLSHEVEIHEGTQPPLGEAGFLADTVLLLRRDTGRDRTRRTLEVVKSRGQDFCEGRHTLAIHAGAGARVYRRMSCRARTYREQLAAPTVIAPVGCDVLDNLLDGGLLDGSLTLLAGVSGVGKTVLSMQMLAEGAARLGKRGLLVSFDEAPSQLLRNAETLGLDLRGPLEAGTLHLLYDCPHQREVDIHFDRVVRAVEEHRIERLVIDGLSGFSTALGSYPRYREFVQGLTAFCRARQVTGFFNYEDRLLFGRPRLVPGCAIASVMDNIVFLDYARGGGRLRRMITPVKMRGRPHRLSSREFVIEPGGARLLPAEADAPAVMPLYCAAARSSV